MIHGRRARPDRRASVSVRPAVEIVAGPELDRRDLELVRRWIGLNREAIIADGNGDLPTDDVIPAQARSSSDSVETRSPRTGSQASFGVK